MRKDEAEYIEAHYDVDALRINNHPIWVYLRMVYHAYFQRRFTGYPQTKTGRLRTRSQTLSQLASSFYGMKEVFKRRPYIVFSDAALRKKVNGMYVDKQFEYLIEKIGQDNVLCVESLTAVQPKHYPKALIPTKHHMSYSFFLLLSTVFWTKRTRISGKQELKRLINKFDITLNHDYFFKNFTAQHLVMKWWLKWFKPKVIFVNSYYGKMPIIKAAKDLLIPVVEIQHGMIEHDDIAYFARKPNLDLSYFPDYFLCFGEREKQYFLNNTYPLIPPENVFPVGNYLIDLVLKTFKPNPKIERKKAHYKVTITVSGQDEREEDILNFLKDVVALNPEVLFLYVPRRFDKDGIPKHYDVPDAIFIVRDISVYEAILHGDFHSAVHSTCAIEALSLGVQNILIDIDGISSEFFGKILTDTVITKFAKTPKDFLDYIHRAKKSAPEDIMERNKENITSGFCKKIDAFLMKLHCI